MIKIIVTALFTFFTSLVYSQSFEAKIITGFAASQIDGDGLTGYNQLGAVFGGATNFNISEKIKFQQEIVYYGRGSRAGAEEISAPVTRIGLHYLDINGLAIYAINESFSAQGGLGVGVPFLLNSDFQNNDDLGNYNNDFFWTIGGGYRIKEGISAVARFQYSVFSIFKFRQVANNSINFSLRFTISGNK